MARKNLNSSTSSGGATKNVFDFYFDMNKIQKVPINSTIADQMASEFLSSFKDPNVVRMSQVYKKWGMIQEEFTRLRNKFPQLEQAYRYGLERLGERRELGSIFKDGDLDWAVVNRTQSHYCSIAKEQAAEAAALRNKDDNKQNDVEAFKAAVSQLISNN